MNQTEEYPAVTEERLTEVVPRVLRVGSPHRIVHFGSQARGDAQPDNDLDLLILEDSEQPSDMTTWELGILRQRRYRTQPRVAAGAPWVRQPAQSPIPRRGSTRRCPTTCRFPFCVDLSKHPHAVRRAIALRPDVLAGPSHGSASLADRSSCALRCSRSCLPRRTPEQQRTEPLSRKDEP
jgi:hypothetical protein